MAENEPMTNDDILRLIMGGQEDSIAAQREIASMNVEGTLEQQRRQQEFLKEASAKAQGYYDPYIKMGQDWQKEYDSLYSYNRPTYSWNKQFTNDSFNWDKTPQTQTWDQYSKDRFTPEGIKSSPYYGLYQYQKDQQSQATNKELAGRGLYNSGAGLKQALNKQSGIDESFTANEYNRARGEYATDYEQAMNDYTRQYNEALQSHNMNYEEAKQKYGMSYDQYNKTFAIKSGQYADQLANAKSMADYGWLGSQASANAAIGTGQQLGQGAIQTGQTLAGIGTNLQSGIGASYNAQGNQLASIYGSNNVAAAQAAALAAGQANFGAYNTTGQIVGGLTALSGLGRSAFDAYRYYNQPAATPTSVSGAGNLSSGYYGDNFYSSVPGYSGTNAASELWY